MAVNPSENMDSDTDSAKNDMNKNDDSISQNSPGTSAGMGTDEVSEEPAAGESSSGATQNSNSLFAHILQENRIFIKRNAEGSNKLFYYLPVGEPIDILLSEGNMEEYQVHSIGGQKYYPLIVGYEEAKVMRSEGLFYDIGDPIKNFFGKNVVVVGVMQRTGGALDVVHLIPLNEEELS